MGNGKERRRRSFRTAAVSPTDGGAAVDSALSPAQEALRVHDRRELNSDLDLTDAAGRFGFRTAGALLTRIGQEYDVTGDKRLQVAEQLARDDLLMRQDGELPTLHMVLPRAVGKVMVREYAQQSRVEPHQYVVGFMGQHNLLSPAEVYDAMAFVAAGYQLKEACSVVRAERDGHEFIKYKGLVWITASVVKEPSLLRALIGLAAMLVVVVQGTYAVAAVIAGTDGADVNPDVPPPEAAFTSQRLGLYWDWLTAANGYRQSWYWLRVWRLLCAMVGVASVVDAALNLCSNSTQARVADRGLFDTTPNRLLRFFNTFVCVTCVGNVWVWYEHDANTPAAVASTLWLLASIVCAYFLQSVFYLQDAETFPVGARDHAVVLLIDVLLMNWLRIVLVCVVCVVFVALLPVTILVIMLGGVRLLCIGCVGEGCDDCCDRHSCTAAVVSGWFSGLSFLLRESIM